MPGANSFNEFLACVQPLNIKRVCNGLHVIKISRNNPSEAEDVQMLAHDYGPIDRGKGCNKMGKIEKSLIKEHHCLAFTIDVFLPTDHFFGVFRLPLEFRKSIHNLQDEGTKTLPRLFFKELILEWR